MNGREKNPFNYGIYRIPLRSVLGLQKGVQRKSIKRRLRTFTGFVIKVLLVVSGIVLVFVVMFNALDLMVNWQFYRP